MKFFSCGVFAIPLLFVANSFSQSTLKEQLKIAEQNSITTKLDSIVNSISDLKSANTYDFIGLKACQNLDSLMVFVIAQKQIAAATFDVTIKPYLEEKLLELNMKTLDFTDDENVIYESFINVLNYNNALPTVKLYEDLIVKNYKDQTLMANILTVMSYIKYVCFYVSKEVTNAFFKYTIHCFAADLKSYNVLNWKVFAIHPGAMTLWTIAACAWDAKSEK